MSAVFPGFMTLAGDINETGHLDDGIFPVYVSTLACSGLPDCLPDWVTGRLAGWLAGCLPTFLAYCLFNFGLPVMIQEFAMTRWRRAIG